MQNKAPAENKMGVMPIPKLIINMSLPMILSMLVQALYNVVDSYFVARFEQDALTAVSLAFPAQNLMIGLATGTAVGVNALLSRALGEKKPKLAIIDYGVDYLTVVCCFSFGIFGQIMFERLMQSTGRTIYTMFTQGIGAIINIILDPVFIFTLNLGAKGAAIATVIGQIVAFALAVILNRMKNDDIRLNLRAFRPDWRLIGRIYAIGIPSVIMMAIGSVMTFLMNIILINYTSAKEISATVFGVYFKLNSFVFMPVFGLNNGIIPIIAYNYGARNRRRMMQAVKLAIVYAASYIFLGLLAFMIIPGPLLGIFNASPEMLAVGVPALRIIGSTFLFAGVCIAMGSVFQALGYGTYSMIVSFARQLVALLPAAYILALIGMNAGNDTLVWYSFPIAEVASLITTLVLFRRLYNRVIKPIPEGAQ